jgi:hypothetical protein
MEGKRCTHRGQGDGTASCDSPAASVVPQLAPSTFCTVWISSSLTTPSALDLWMACGLEQALSR